MAIVDVVDIAPSAAIDRLHESVFTDVGEDRVPVERILEVAHGAVGGAFRVFLVGQDNGGRDGDAEFGGEGVVEKFVVGRPPEGIVDDDGAVERGVFEVGAIERDVVGDAIDDDGVGRGLVEVDGAGFNELGVDAVDIAGIDVFDERAGKTVFHAEQDTDFFHPLDLRGGLRDGWGKSQNDVNSVRQAIWTEGALFWGSERGKAVRYQRTKRTNSHPVHRRFTDS